MASRTGAGRYLPVSQAWRLCQEDSLRREAAAAIPKLIDDLATWVDIDAIAWGQRYAVTTACQILYTLETAQVASKHGAVEWAQRTLDARWRPLLG